MAPVEDVVPVWLGSEGVSHSVLPDVATISRPHAALAVNSVRMAVLKYYFTFSYSQYEQHKNELCLFIYSDRFRLYYQVCLQISYDSYSGNVNSN